MGWPKKFAMKMMVKDLTRKSKYVILPKTKFNALALTLSKTETPKQMKLDDVLISTLQIICAVCVATCYIMI